MKGVQVWQHPYVDVFKYVSLSEWRQSSKEGDVSETIDKTLGKKVFKLQGSVSASNYIQIPRPKSEMKSLALNGKYVYIVMQVPPGKLFSLHLDLQVFNTRTNSEEPLKVSLSNLFKENKLQSFLQVSCKIAAKWTVVCVDIKNLLFEYFAERLVHKELKAVNLCANMTVRGVYTSDILYSPKTMPKEIALKSPKVEEWGKFYDWMFLPERFVDENLEKVEELPLKARSSSVSKPKEVRKVEISNKSKPRRNDKKQEVKEESQKTVNEEIKANHSENDENNSKSKALKAENPGKKLEKPSESPSKPPPRSGKAEDVKRNPGKLVRALKKSNSEPKIDIVQELNEKGLHPDPILVLDNILSITPSSNSLLWLPADYFSSYSNDFKANTNKVLVYTSNSTIVAINPFNKSKSFYFAHNSKVTILGLHQHFLVSADESCLILFWPIKSRKRPVPLTMKKFKEVSFISFFSTKMVVSGKDDLRRDCLMIFDTSRLVKKREVVQVAQQLSDFDIRVIKFFEELKLVSCGKEGVRIWQAKDDRFTSSSVNLIEKDQSCCTDLDISGKKAFVINTKSSVLVINLNTKDCETCVFLNSSELFRIKILEDIVMVSSADCFVRFWPLDFKEVYMEVQHKSKVLAADMLGTNAATLTDSGVLVSIDLQASTLDSLGKNYPGSIHVSSGSEKHCVVNNAIHVLNEDFSPFCEFASAKDDPKVAVISKCETILACGYFSGAVRVFDLQKIQLIEEFLHLKSPIENLSISPDGKVMLAIAEDGNFSVFDGNQAFQPVKDGKIEVPSAFSASFSSDSSYFAMISNFSMSVSLFSTNPLSQKFKINTNNPFLHLCFSGKLLLTLLSDPSQMNYYSITDNKLLNFKQVQLPCQLLKFAVSCNNSYIIGSSPDFSVKVFDFFFTYPCQVFLGHSSEIKEIVWNRESLSTLSEKDGTLFWKFKGELSSVKSIENDCEEAEELSEKSEEPLEVDVEREVEAYLRHVESITANMMVSSSPSLTCLFGFSPFFNGVFWAQEKGFLIYTVGAIVVKTLLVGEKKQLVMHAHYNSITVAALSPDQNLLATAEGNASFSGVAKIHVWNLDTCKVTKVLEFHEKSVTCLQFSPCSSYLCSIGSDPEPILVIWELVLNRPIASSILASPGLQVKWLPQLAYLEFVTLSADSVLFWRLNSLKRLEFQPGESSLQDLTCVEYSPYFEDLSSHLLLMGTSKGSIVITNVRTNTLVLTKQLVSARIHLICSRSQSVMVAGEFPEVYLWKWADGLFAGTAQKVLFDGVPVSLSFNQEGTEGTVATTAGSIWYTEWMNGTVRIISSHIQDITAVAGGEVLATGSADNTIRIWNPLTSEQVSQIYTPNSICTCLAFHKSLPYLVAGFSDGSLKAFEVYTNKCLGSSRSLLGRVTCLTFTPDSDCLVIGSESGLILAVVVSKWSPFVIDFFEFCNMGKEILAVDCKARQVLASTSAGLLNIWEKKFTGEVHEKLFDKSQEFNLIDFFDFKEPYERTKHVYPQAESLECKAKFDVISEKLVWIIIRGAQYLIQRNFSSHQVLRKINLAGFPLCLDVFEHRIAVGLADRRVMVYADGNIHEFLTHSAPVLQLALFNKGLATVSGNEIGYWSIY